MFEKLKTPQDLHFKLGAAQNLEQEEHTPEGIKQATQQLVQRQLAHAA